MQKRSIMSWMLIAMFSFISLASANQGWVCTADYTPVCAKVTTPCAETVCPSHYQTFWNACMMEAHSNAVFAHEGACTDTEAKDNPLKNTEWNLIRLDDQVVNETITMRFDETKISGKFCNDFGGSYTISGDKIIAKDIAQTQMFCHGEQMKYENWFNPSNVKYTLSENDKILTLTQEDHTFVWEKIDRNEIFTKSSRILATFNNQPVAEKATLQFSGNQVFAQFCNTMRGEYRLDNTTFINDGLMSTRMACGGELGEYENAFNLSGATFTILQKDQLLITTSKDDRYVREKQNESDNDSESNSLSDQQKIHAVLDAYFSKHAKTFPSKKEKSELILRLKNIFTEASKTVSGDLLSAYQTLIEAFENYLVH